MKVLVTGGAGYIGSILVPRLLKEGHEVTVIDNFMYQQTSLLDCCFNESLRIIRGDVRDRSLLQKELSRADAIVALAAWVGAPVCARDPEGSRRVNTDAVKFLCDHKSKSQLLLYPCTNSGYGIGQTGIHCDESSPLQPISEYGRQKVEAERHLLDTGEAISFRLATVFGISPRMRLDLLVNDFTYRAVTDGFIVLFEPHFKRNYLHVQDAAAAFLHGIQHYESMKGNAFNVGLSEANLSKEELCGVIQQQIPRFTILSSAVGEDPDKRNYIVSNAKIEASGFRARVSLDQGIQELIRGYQIIRRNQFTNL